ncbi:hypothetical protein OROMI_033438 [Orobanche minor]
MKMKMDNDFVGVEEINDHYNAVDCDKNMPPADDVCPICFDRFTIPCRSNCGHWFCARCILHFWMFKTSIQPCKCPLCCRPITNLKPETCDQPSDDVCEILNKVHQYNGLYISGMLGIFHRLLALPLIMRRIFRVLIDPDGLRCIYYGMRIIGLLLALLYEKWEFEFVPTGGLGIQRAFDMVASVLILTLLFIGLGHRFVLRAGARRMAGTRPRDS